jgi:hypothetical protein
MSAGGDGPKRALLQQMISTEGLEGRVTLAGAIPHERARDFLVGVTTHGSLSDMSTCLGCHRVQSLRSLGKI